MNIKIENLKTENSATKIRAIIGIKQLRKNLTNFKKTHLTYKKLIKQASILG